MYDPENHLKCRFIGSLFGLAVGDALGATAEFKPRGTFEAVTDIVGGGVYMLEAGQWTDDTSMTLCLAESLIESQGMDLSHQLEKYLLWYEKGYLSSTGACFGIGNTVKTALETFKRVKEPYSGPKEPQFAGNGSLMRLAPVALLYSDDLNVCIKMCAESSKTTHRAQEAVEACEFFGSLICGAASGLSKEKLLSKDYIKGVKQKGGVSWSPNIDAIANGSYKEKSAADIQSSGYVIHTLEAALWAFYHSTSFEDGLIKAVNLGDDADTTGAVYGQLAGAFYGFENIPQKWTAKIALKEIICDCANMLYALHIQLKS